MPRLYNLRKNTVKVLFGAPCGGVHPVAVIDYKDVHRLGLLAQDSNAQLRVVHKRIVFERIQNRILCLLVSRTLQRILR